MATKMNMPKKEDISVLQMDQKEPLMHRYWLQVDRQTKASYPTLEEAEAKGKEIKAAHLIVQVSIYDAEKSQQTMVTE